MMKKTFQLLALLVGMVILSGCSLSQFLAPLQKKEKKKPPIGSIWKTSDGGKSFGLKVNLEESLPLSSEGKEKTEQSEKNKPKIITSDILAITFHPENSNVIYAGTVNHGIFKTENGGETWKHIDFPPKRIDSFTLDRRDPDNKMFASGVVGEVGKILRTENGGQNWQEVYTEPGPKTLITSMSQSSKDPLMIFAGTSGGTIVKSIDGGETWRNIGQVIDGKITALPFDSKFLNSVYALSFARKVYYSKNGGENWIDWEWVKKEEIDKLRQQERELRREKNLKAANEVRKRIDFLVEKNKEEKMPAGIVSIRTSPFASGLIYAGTQRGELYYSSDYGKYWKRLNIIESATKFPIRMITPSHINSREISFVAGMAFYKSLDQGKSWMVTYLNVDRPISVITYDPKDSNVIYLGLSRDYDELKK